MLAEVAIAATLVLGVGVVRVLNRRLGNPPAFNEHAYRAALPVRRQPIRLLPDGRVHLADVRAAPGATPAAAPPPPSRRRCERLATS